MSDIKPCPFCGTQPDYDDANNMNVECPSCGITGPAGIHIGKESAIEAWNARAAVQANVPDVPEDGFTVNFVVHAGLDKTTARKCEAIVRDLLSAIQKG